MFYAAKIEAAKLVENRVFVLISLEDHMRHTQQIAQVLAHRQACIAAAACHDVGKKTNLEPKIAQRKPSDAAAFLEAYIDWLIDKTASNDKKKEWETKLKEIELNLFVHELLFSKTRKERHAALQSIVKQYGVRIDDGQLSTIAGMSFSPFPNHADHVPLTMQEEELPEAGCPEGWEGYAFELIRLHHSFRVDKIVATASALEAAIAGAQARNFVEDLHNLISADNIASALYGKVLRAADGELRIGDPADDGFLLHDLLVHGTIEWGTISTTRHDVKVHLNWEAEAKGKRSEVTINLVYHIVEVN